MNFISRDRGKVRKFLFKKDNYGYLFLMPFFITFFMLQLYPILYTLYLSFTNMSITNPTGVWPTGSSFGFGNYIKLFSDQFFHRSIYSTWRIWIINFIPQLIFALGLASILTRSKIRGKNFLRGVYFLPNLVTAASIALLFNMMLGWEYGPINQILVALRIIGPDAKIHFLFDVGWSRTSISVILWWMWFGHSMILFMAAMVAVPKQYYDAAAVDGAGAWHSFWKITLPLIRPVMIYVLVTSLIGGMNNFDIPFIIGEGQALGGALVSQQATRTMVMHLYISAFRGDLLKGYGAAVAFAIFIIVLIFSIIIFKLMTRRETEGGRAAR